jgi:hypothetical protein
VKTDTNPIQWPWPFPQWDGTKFVMPVDLMPLEVRKEFLKRSKQTPDLDDIEEALL